MKKIGINRLGRYHVRRWLASNFSPRPGEKPEQRGRAMSMRTQRKAFRGPCAGDSGFEPMDAKPARTTAMDEVGVEGRCGMGTKGRCVGKQVGSPELNYNYPMRGIRPSDPLDLGVSWEPTIVAFQQKRRIWCREAGRCVDEGTILLGPKMGVNGTSEEFTTAELKYNYPMCTTGTYNFRFL